MISGNTISQFATSGIALQRGVKQNTVTSNAVWEKVAGSAIRDATAGANIVRDNVGIAAD